MCMTCGCGIDVQTHGAAHHHDATDHRQHDVEHRLLAKNERHAVANREWLRERGVLALNLVSSPGAGKTTLLERTIADLRRSIAMHVIEGDQATSRDADRIRAAGCAAIQINTGSGCHLDAVMIQQALGKLEPQRGGILFIENVGNLVCPALFDLGERAKVLVASVTEGEDKPLKYPHMFRASRLVLVNKADLLDRVSFDLAAFSAYARQVNPHVDIFAVSALGGSGLDRWYSWLTSAHGRS